MVTDRELMELAAKAAGYTLIGYNEETYEGICLHKNGEEFFWNPRTDDGDALRLAIKLEFAIRFDMGFVGVSNARIFVSEPYLMEDYPYAATRRAIFRAATEIGKAMP